MATPARSTLRPGTRRISSARWLLIKFRLAALSDRPPVMRSPGTKQGQHVSDGACVASKTLELMGQRLSTDGAVTHFVKEPSGSGATVVLGQSVVGSLDRRPSRAELRASVPSAPRQHAAAAVY